MRNPTLSLLLALVVLLGPAVAQDPSVPTPDGRYVCYQGGLSSSGATYWGYVDLNGTTYTPFTGSGGTVSREGDDLLAFEGGIFERYDWVGVVRTRDDGGTEMVLLERADLEAFRAGEGGGGGSGYVVYCGWDGTR